MVDHDALVDLACDEALQAADDVLLRQALGGAARDVVDGRLMEAHADDHGAVDRSVGLAVTAAVETVLVRETRRRRDRTGAAELRERCFGPDPFGVVTEHDQHLCGGVGADAVAVAQRR